MKKVVVILLSLLIATSIFADFTWAQINICKGVNMANGWGDTSNDTYLEIAGGGRTGCINLFYFIDVNSILGLGDNAVGGEGKFFTKINPRFSLSKFVPKMGPISEIYVATQYKGFNDGAYYYVGLGTDLEVPLLERFSANFYSMMQHVSDVAEDEINFENAGFVVSINWYTTLYKVNDKMNFSYQGWSDFGFANSYAEDIGEPHTSDEFQMFNGFFLNYNKISLSASVKLHNHFMYSEAVFGNHDAISYFFGLHRKF